MSIVLPAPQLCLTAADAGAIAQRGRKLLRKRRISPHAHALLDALLWQARKPGQAELIASLNVLARLAGQGRTAVVKGIQRLTQLGLVQRIRRRVRVAWISGATASRQIANAYRLLKDSTEAARQPTYTGIQIFTFAESNHAQREAQESLTRIRNKRTAELQKRLLRKE